LVYSSSTHYYCVGVSFLQPSMRIPLFSCLFLIFRCFCLSMSAGQKDGIYSRHPEKDMFFPRWDGNQQSLLLQWKNNVVFDNASSTKLVHWNQNVNCCLWEGVICSDGGCVIGLDLTNGSISGWLDNSSSHSCLPSLLYWGLAYNKLKTFPHFLSDQFSLSGLDRTFQTTRFMGRYQIGFGIFLNFTH
jgi:hypothetical protein